MMLTHGGALWAPVWDQLHDPDSLGPADTAAQTDCGEEVSSEIIMSVTNQATTERELREDLGKGPFDGRTNGGDIVRLLSMFGVPSHGGTPDSGGMVAMVREQLGNSCLTAVLGYYVSPAVLHWVLVRQSWGVYVRFNDPYGGIARQEKWSWLQRWYGGQVVAVLEASKRGRWR